MQQTLEFLSRFKIDFLAEKVETHDQFGEAQRLGFKYFQGYFFARPEEMRIKELSTSKTTLLNLLSEINQQKFSAKKLTAIISADVSLSYRLLRYINSAYFYLLTKITSIPYAVTYLGENEIRRFVTLAVISEISSNKPVELVRLAAVRAKFCEKLGQECPGEINQNELFLLGLLSLLDAMLDTPITDILKKIPVSDNIKRALIDRDGPLSIFLKIVTAYERGNHEECFQAVKQLRVSEEKLYPMYLSSLEYADAFVNL
jgi:EAL and modified HD-GYP domain-containing signal transduction protein